MKEQQKTPAQAALDTLNEAWAYYTREQMAERDTPVYEDLPVAA